MFKTLVIEKSNSTKDELETFALQNIKHKDKVTFHHKKDKLIVKLSSNPENETCTE